MFQYWIRIVGAMLLLRLASSIVKDAQDLIAKAASPEARTIEVIEDAEVVTP